MRKLALNDEILLNIEKPARYIGNEVNSVMKDKKQVDIRFCMCFPDVYEIGMSGRIRDRHVTSGDPDPLRHVQPQGRHMV